MNQEKLYGIVGSTLGVVGTSMQVDDILKIISLIITILGGIITWIIIPLLNWYKNAKKDGKIDVDEIKDGINVLQDGIDKIKPKERKEDDKDESKGNN